MGARPPPAVPRHIARQFHCVGAPDAERNCAAIAERAEKIIDEAVRALVGEGQHLLAVNAAPHARAGVPALGIGLLVTRGREVEAEEGDGGFTLTTDSFEP